MKRGNFLVSWAVMNQNQESDKLPLHYFLLSYAQTWDFQSQWNFTSASLWDRESYEENWRSNNNTRRYTQNFLTRKQNGFRKCPVLPVASYFPYSNSVAATITHQWTFAHLRQSRENSEYYRPLLSSHRHTFPFSKIRYKRNKLEVRWNENKNIWVSTHNYCRFKMFEVTKFNYTVRKYEEK